MLNEIDISGVPNIKIDHKAWKKMHYYTQLCDDEILGMLVIEEEENTLRITDIIIPEQEVSAASCDPTVKGLAEVANKIDIKKLRGWYHTHPRFGVSPSGIDTNTIKEWSEGEIPYLLTLIGNKNGEISVRLDVFKPMKFRIKNLKLQIVFDDDENLKELCQEDINKKVKEYKWEPPWKKKKKKEKKGRIKVLDEMPHNVKDDNEMGIPDPRERDHWWQFY